MRVDFETWPLQVAHREAVQIKRQYLDWVDFMAENYRHHYLITGMGRHAYDRCHRVSLVDWADAPYPEEALIRPYLETICWAQGGEAPAIYDPGLLIRTPPLYFSGPTEGELTVVDLDAAYWQIYSPTSLDLRYDGESEPRNGAIRFLGATELGRYKQLRNAIVGTVRAENRVDLDFGTPVKVEVSTQWRRPSLWAFVMDILELVAWDMRTHFGAVHIHTDGYILRHPDLATDAVQYLSDRWGLSASIRAIGFGHIQALGSWEVARERSGEPQGLPGEYVDSMGHVRAQPFLRQWFVDAKDHFDATKKISCTKRLDGKEIDW